MVLLENGKLVSWGDNITGNIGVYRSWQELDGFEYKELKFPLEEASLDEKVKSFSLSSNMMSVVMESGNAYYCGLDKDFKLRKINFPEGEKAVNCGSV